MKHLLIAFFILMNFHFCLAQHYVLDSIKPTLGHLINFEANKLHYVNESPQFKVMFEKLNRIYNGAPEKFHIFHIGGSHIQADIYSNKLRTYFHNSGLNMQGQRGFVFPYHLAHTNNPINYRIEADKSKWTGYRCSISKDSIAWGLAGITAAFREKADTIYIKSNYRNYTKNKYDFNKLRIFYNTWKDDYQLKFLDSTLVASESINKASFYKEYQLTKTLDSVAVSITLKDTTTVNPEFLFMGLEYMNDNPGIEYTSIGVNGASFNKYNRCAFFENQFNLYKPDLFIISIGTNDAYMPPADFNAEEFRLNYEAFIWMIQRNNPDCAILLTVPNDDYYKRKKPNSNTKIQEQIILELGQKYHMAVWNLFDIMGGLGSSNKWYKNKLMPKDRIHFTYLGYDIKADLFLEAFVEAWATSTYQNPEILMHNFKTLDE